MMSFETQDYKTQKFLGFALEFIGIDYRLNKTITKKYLKPPGVIRTGHNSKYQITKEELDRLRECLSFDFFEKILKTRYRLFDFCYRKEKDERSIGFNFYDPRDSSIEDYITLFSILNFDMCILLSLQEQIQLLFREEVHYNPLSMIGVMFQDERITSIKTYVRFNKDLAPKTNDRLYLLKRIMEHYSFYDKSKAFIYFERLETLGLEFSFIGTDYINNHQKRIKLYFKIGENWNSNHFHTLLDLQDLYLNVRTNSVNNEMCGSRLWGLAISLADNNVIEGIQYYFYPQ